MYFFVVTLVLGCGCLALALWRRYFHPVSSIPGPFWASISPWWLAYVTYRGDFCKRLHELHLQYRDNVRVGPNEIQTRDPTVIQELYRKRLDKGPRYNVLSLDDPQGKAHPKDLFTETVDSVHSKLRRVSTVAYARTDLMESEISDCVALFIKQLQTVATSATPIRWDQWTSWFGGDVITLITLGKRAGFLERQASDQFLPFMHQTLGRFHWMAPVSSHKAVLGTITNFFSSNTADYFHVLAKFQKYIGDGLAGQMALGGKEQASLFGALYQRHIKHPDELSLEKVATQAAGSIFAGSDTTSIAIFATVYYLVKNPNCYEKLQLEVDEVKMKSGKEIFEYKDAQSMPYLKAVIQESMRLWPSAVFNLQRRLSPASKYRVDICLRVSWSVVTHLLYIGMKMYMAQMQMNLGQKGGLMGIQRQYHSHPISHSG